MLGSNLSAEQVTEVWEGAVRSVRPLVLWGSILWSKRRKIPGVWGLAPIKIRQNSFFLLVIHFSRCKVIKRLV
jgi:hypothetical protein